MVQMDLGTVSLMTSFLYILTQLSENRCHLYRLSITFRCLSMLQSPSFSGLLWGPEQSGAEWFSPALVALFLECLLWLDLGSVSVRLRLPSSHVM